VKTFSNEQVQKSTPDLSRKYQGAFADPTRKMRIRNSDIDTF